MTKNMRISIVTRLLDLIAPRVCTVCGSRLSPTEDTVCQVCLLHLPRTGYARSPEDNPMARLFWGLMPVERAAALFFHLPHTESARIVYAMKYGGRADAAITMGRIMAREFACAGFFDGIDVMVPVPLTRKRKRNRGYNQSELIARGIGEVTGIPVDTEALERTAFSSSQTTLTRRMRRDNVKDAFRLADGSRLANRHVLLVDDVITSGATTMACGACLAGIPGIRLSVITLAFAKG